MVLELEKSSQRRKEEETRKQVITEDCLKIRRVTSILKMKLIVI